jgi:polar amino acid transport system permease protein
MKQSLFHSKRFITNAAIIAALAVFCIVMIATRPPREEVLGLISPTLIEEAGSRYAETECNYILFFMGRGKNMRTAETMTFMGIFGSIIRMDEGFLGAVADILFWLPALLGGTYITVSLTIVSVLAGVFGSIFLALGKISKFKPLSAFCSAYIFFFRGTPLLMQLFFIYYAMPLIHPALTINNKFLAAFIAFALNSAAYCAEIVRAAIQSIEKGQFEAAHSLGFTYAQTMSLIIMPQSVRRLIPPIANEFIMVLKDASIVSLIALADLTQTTRSISSSSASVLVFLPSMGIYLIITALFTAVFNWLEKRFSIY